jgi:DNA-directed RNA polymerase specialized sigma24 family protein
MVLIKVGISMVAGNKELGLYLNLIKKITAWKVKTPEHKEFIEDIAQETFLKLLKRDFFNEHDISDAENEKIINSYVHQTVWSCYMDQLKLQGINRKLTKSEAEASGGRYQNIVNSPIEEVCDSETAIHAFETPEQHLFAREVYQWIKNCFETLSLEIKNIERKRFFYAAFWEFSAYDLPMKALAGHLGYQSSNPTQELKRFIDKVTLCTQPHGITVSNPHEQIQFLQEQLDNSGVML